VVQDWIRQALRAAGVAILVPAAVAAAIALTVLGGGSGVGSLGQVLTGPAAPPAEAAAPTAATPRRDARPPTHAVAPRAALSRPAPASGVAPPQRRPVTTLPEAPSRHPVHPPPAQPTAPPAAPTSPPAQPPAAPPHPIHDAGTQIAQMVRPLPLAGPAAADAVQAVVDLVDPPA